jgi:protein Tex
MRAAHTRPVYYMQSQFIPQIATELNIQPEQVSATTTLIAEGGTVPFIARYRKEQTQSLDEVQITAIRDRLLQLAELAARRDSITNSLQERQLLTEALAQQLAATETMAQLEDIYLPYRPKRRTKAMIARERGLEALAHFIFENQNAESLTEQANQAIDAEKEVPDIKTALTGARHIIAEWISDDASARAALRELYWQQGVLSSEAFPGKETEGAKFSDYFDWQEAIKNAPSHRILAIRRGEKEGFLFHRILPPEESAIMRLEKQFLQGCGVTGNEVKIAIEDSYKRLLAPAMETEVRMKAKKIADAAAIQVFAANARELLLASPLGQKRTLAIDPGFRTGCKTVVLDAQGQLLFNQVLFCTGSAAQIDQAKVEAKALIERYQIEAIAIGNGTAGRETESFFRQLGLAPQILIISVNESGASIYSASEAAREEFPEQDLTVRGAVSIGRRLMDPLAELVKIDPKSIGVGQYQHDVDQFALKRILDDTVTSCVNLVGVEVNTASKQLLSYVAGLNDRIASNIVAYRQQHGPFKSRLELKKVSQLGPKAFEQSAGFLRIRNAIHSLDGSGVHPERYALVEKMSHDAGCSLRDLSHDSGIRAKIKLEQYVTDNVGLPTLKDIMQELSKPGRDPRKRFEAFSFAAGVDKPSDLELGMKLAGRVTNVTAFGAFIDIGVHQDGLVHISQLSDSFVDDPHKVVKVGEKVQVTVTEVDLPRNRIALSMKLQPEIGQKKQRNNLQQTSKKSQQAKRSSNKRSQKTGQENFGGNWFDAALKK